MPELSLIDVISTEFDEENDDEMPVLLQHSPYYDDDNGIELLREKGNMLSILSLNCQSLQAKIDQLKIYLNNFEEARCPFSIICLQETWLTNDHNESFFQLNGYTFVRNSISCSRHGGVAIYIRNNFEFEILPINGNQEIWDGLFLEVYLRNANCNVECRRKKVIIGNIYRPPRETVENYTTFIGELEEILSTTLRNNKEIIIAGDFNIDLLKIKNSAHVNSFFEMMITCGFLPKITFPTRITSHSSTLIDNCFVKLSFDFSHTTAGIFNYNISDHQPYFVILDYLTHIEENDRYIKTYKNTPAAKQNFKNDLASNCTIDKFNLNDHADPNINYGILNNLLKTAIDKNLPVKYVRYDKYKHRKSKWITKGILRSIKFRDKLYTKLRSTPESSLYYNTYKINLMSCYHNFHDFYLFIASEDTVLSCQNALY